ncbi:MAG: hypothetical protein R3284_06045 [Rubricoccaceae bacterium]|nr:hypothetical protein [Rubricoccaceae bacterium]
MGQQQLLLLVIAIVLVGIAVVAGLQIMQKYYRHDEGDGLLDRGLSIATHAVYWKTKNDAFAGGNQSYEELGTIGIEGLGVDPTTIRGRYAFTSATQSRLEITGVSDRYPDVGIRVFVDNYSIDSSYVRYDGSLTLD